MCILLGHFCYRVLSLAQSVDTESRVRSLLKKRWFYTNAWTACYCIIRPWKMGGILSHSLNFTLKPFNISDLTENSGLRFPKTLPNRRNFDPKYEMVICINISQITTIAFAPCVQETIFSKPHQNGPNDPSAFHSQFYWLWISY